MRQAVGLLVGDLLAADDHAQFAAGLNRVGLHDAGIGEGHVFHLLQPLDVRFDHFAAGSRTGSGDRVADLYDR